jgi:hypothetical protein
MLKSITELQNIQASKDLRVAAFDSKFARLKAEFLILYSNSAHSVPDRRKH